MSSFELRYKIDKVKEEVWECFFNQLGEWWTADFYTSPRTLSFKIETRLGGKMYEDFGNDEGLVWGEVIGVDYPKSLQVRGMLSGEFGGPALSYEKFVFSEEEGQTELKYRTEFIGDISKKSLNSLETGWKSIFEDYFIPFCTK